MDNRWLRLSVLLSVLMVAMLPLSACIMVPGTAETRGLSGEGPVKVTPVAVALALRAQVFEDGIHVRGDEGVEEYVHWIALESALKGAGILGKAAPAPTADSLNLLVEVEEERTGPRGLRVLSTVTFRLVPSWTTVHYRIRAHGSYRGRPIPRFAFENTATQIENLLLFPVAPFVSPQSARVRMRGEAMQALAAHLTRALAEDAPASGGGGS